MRENISASDVTYVAEDGSPSIVALWNGREIGKLVYVDQGDGERLLSDVFVEKKIVLQQSLWANLRRRFSPGWGIVSASGLGIGTQLVQRFLLLCQQDAIREVFGNVTRDGDDSQPFLRGWYERLGFRIAPLDGRAEYGEVAYKVIWNPQGQQ